MPNSTHTGASVVRGLIWKVFMPPKSVTHRQRDDGPTVTFPVAERHTARSQAENHRLVQLQL